MAKISLSNLEANDQKITHETIEGKYDYCNLLLRLYSHDLISDYLFINLDQTFIVGEIVALYDLHNNKSKNETINNCFTALKSTENLEENTYSSDTKLEVYIERMISLAAKIKDDYELTKQCIDKFIKKYLLERKGKIKTIGKCNKCFLMNIDTYLSSLTEEIEYYTFLKRKIDFKTSNIDINYLHHLEETGVDIRIVISTAFSTSYFSPNVFKTTANEITEFYIKLKIIKYEFISAKIIEELDQINLLLENNDVYIKNKEAYDEIFNIGDFIERTNLEVFINLILKMSIVCDLYNDIETIPIYFLETYCPDDFKNWRKSSILFYKKFINFKNYFTNDNLKKFFEKNVKNNFIVVRFLNYMNLKTTNIKLKEMTEQYYANLKILFEKIKACKEKTKNEFNEIIKSPLYSDEKYNQETLWIRSYANDIISLSYDFYKTTYDFYYSEYLSSYCSYSLNNKLFFDFPYRFFKLDNKENESLFLLAINSHFKEILVKSNFNFVQKILTEQKIHDFTDDYLEIPSFIYLERLEREFFEQFFFDFDLSQ